ncbi:MAG: iron-containing alcohol dehydrogenase [Planctomycetota bacterium]
MPAERWTFKVPTVITFGDGVSNQLNEVAAALGHRPVLVTDATVSGVALVKQRVSGLRAEAVFDQVEPNPTVENVDHLAGLLRQTRADVVVALGGGSVIDCAKAASCLACTDEQSIRPYHSEGRTLGDEHLPLVAVPTTAGTGSEVTPFSVLDDRQKQVKGPVAHDGFYPVRAVVDPELSVSMPPGVTAATGLDALCHAIEGYWSTNHQPLCDLLALDAAGVIVQQLETAIAEPEDLAARRAMMRAATEAGLAFQLPKNAMVHACSFPLSNRHHLSHGAACAFTLGEAVRLNAPAMGPRMDRLVEACGCGSVDELIERIDHLKQLGGLPRTLSEAGISPDEIETLIDESFHPLMNNNPHPVTRDDLVAMYDRLS